MLSSSIAAHSTEAAEIGRTAVTIARDRGGMVVAAVYHIRALSPEDGRPLTLNLMNCPFRLLHAEGLGVTIKGATPRGPRRAAFLTIDPERGGSWEGTSIALTFRWLGATGRQSLSVLVAPDLLATQLWPASISSSRSQPVI